MQTPKIPADEQERLLALYRLEVLDTPPDAALDRICRLAARQLDVPTLLVSLVDSERQWFKARLGLDVCETSRDVSFCGHAVFERRPLVVTDAAADPRFADNPLVTSGPKIRAYLGIPLFTLNSKAIGTLCAIDVKPREFTTEQVELLSDFAKLAQETLQAEEVTKQSRDNLRRARRSEQLFRDTFELAAVGMMHIGVDGHLLRINRRISALLGYDQLDLRDSSLFDITHPDDAVGHTELFQRVLSGQMDSYRIEARLLKKDGEYLWAYLALAVKQHAGGDADYLIGVVEDISVRKQTELELVKAHDTLTSEIASQTQKIKDKNQALQVQVKRVLDSERERSRVRGRLRAIANSIPAMIGYWNRSLRCEFANEAYRDWFDHAPEQILGMTMEQLLGKDLFRKNEPAVRMALSGHEQRFERQMKRVDGSDSYVDVRYIPDLNESGAVGGFYVLVTDVTSLREAHAELEQVNARLRHDSTTDYLTGIANRRVFSEQSESAEERCRSSNEPYGLILLDLDNFKNINDTYGHSVGDQVLATVGRVLKEQLRGSQDIAARLGGEEFAILCSGDLTESSLVQLAERIRTQVNSQALPTSGDTLRITCSFGVSLSTAQDLGWKGIYSRADAALYDAKAQGKDRVIFGRAYAKGATGRFRSLRVVSRKGT